MGTDKLLDGMVSRQDLAQQLGLSADTLRRWEAEGDGPASIRVGRRVLYRVSVVNAWLRARERKAKGAGK
ncbi:helix-turn-helix domain-containing protein [Paenibacillus sp. AK121]|uniref:helix-turn-helix transcriptional regulator n=1 Tax=Bacteria TaxID=2 RepID=UPI001C232356|nr:MULTISPECIES: helix-turn-helix domain-containing protein [Bacteria]MBU9710120.1 helix-turn-helix domain-containing protein [Paenibacillus sp. AK121]MCW1920834.1 helix-turn-helix domain-containing protein [Rhodobacter sp. KR11]